MELFIMRLIIVSPEGLGYPGPDPNHGAPRKPALRLGAMTTRSTASALTIDTARSRIAFEARHLVVHPVRGTFGRWSASLQLDERDVLGDFTLHGVTREITIDVTLSQRADRFSFVGKTAIGRKHYGIVWSPAIELSSGVSDRVSIELRLDAIRSADLAQRSDLVP